MYGRLSSFSLCVAMVARRMTRYKMERKGRRSPRVTATSHVLATPHSRAEPSAAAVGPTKPPGLLPKAGAIVAEASTSAETAMSSVSQASISAALQAARSRALGGRAYAGPDVVAAIAQSQAALARGLEALSAEMACLALAGIESAARAAAKLLTVKTFSDAIEVNAGFTYGNLDALVGGSAALSQLGVKVAAETSQPLLSWIKTGMAGS
jgi:hypothetical protein